MNSIGGKVAITGVGLVSPFGTDPTEIARAVADGDSGLAWLREPPPADVKSRGLYAGGLASYESKFGHDPVVEMAVQAAEHAVTDAHLQLSSLDLNRVGSVIGTSKGLLDTYAENFGSTNTPLAYPGFEPNRAALQVARHFGCGGPCLCPIAACATGLACLERGVRLIRSGYCDVVIAGSSDASICDWVLNSFNRLGVLAKNFDQPNNAVRPFSDDRDGFLVGEGAAVFVLESETHARSRQARVRAEWLGSSAGSDPTGMTQIDETGENFAPIIRSCLNRAAVSPNDIDLLNLHGTATQANDTCEANAITHVFGSRPINRRAYKATIGHCLGAAASLEIGLSLVHGGWQTQLKTSLGFGGHSFAAVLSNEQEFGI